MACRALSENPAGSGGDFFKTGNWEYLQKKPCQRDLSQECRTTSPNARQPIYFLQSIYYWMREGNNLSEKISERLKPKVIIKNRSNSPVFS